MNDTIPESPAEPAPPVVEHAPAPPVTATNAPVELVLRKDPDRRVAQRFALGESLAAWAVLAALLPVIVAAIALWPVPAGGAEGLASPSTTAAGPERTPPPIDFAKLRSLAATPAPPNAPPNAPPALALDRRRLEAARALGKKLQRAREARREAGASAAEMRQPFTATELGGPAALDELGVDGSQRFLVGRDGRLVAPAEAALPSGVTLTSKERDEDVLEADASLAGAPVRVLRRCVANEALCVLDVVPRSASATPATTPAHPLLQVVEEQERAWQAWKVANSHDAPAPSPAALPTTSRLPRWLALVLGLIAAVALGGALAWRLVRLGSAVTAAGHRLRSAVRGKATPAPGVDVARELDALHVAIDDAAAAFLDQQARAAADERRRQRATALAAALDDARVRVGVRVGRDESEDPATAEIVAAANRLVESFEDRVVRWRSHVDVVASGERPGARRIEDRAKALAPLPPLLLDVAQRLLRVARLPGLPPKAAEELRALGEALASRGKTARALVDQLLELIALEVGATKAGSEDARVRPAAALASLRQELTSLAPAPPAPTTVHALLQLPPEEIAARMPRVP